MQVNLLDAFTLTEPTWVTVKPIGKSILLAPGSYKAMLFNMFLDTFNYECIYWKPVKSD